MISKSIKSGWDSMNSLNYKYIEASHDWDPQKDLDQILKTADDAKICDPHPILKCYLDKWAIDDSDES